MGAAIFGNPPVPQPYEHAGEIGAQSPPWGVDIPAIDLIPDVAREHISGECIMAKGKACSWK